MMDVDCNERMLRCKNLHAPSSPEGSRRRASSSLRRGSLFPYVLGCSIVAFLTSIGTSLSIPPALVQWADHHSSLRTLQEQDDDFFHPQAFNFSITSQGAPPCVHVEPQEGMDFTLVTQLSAIRLSLMEEHCRRWGPHPISVAVGSQGSPKAIERAVSVMGCDLNLVTVTVVGGGYSKGDYPVNRLRNEAFRAVKTSHAVYLDADFLPSTNLYERLMRHRAALTDPKTALVVPAFDVTSICEASEAECKRLHLSIVPESKEQLMELFELPKAQTAYRNTEDELQSPLPAITQFDTKNKNVDAHGSTRYKDWLNQSGDELLPIECITSIRYEPYLAVRYCEDLPPFQEAFTGYGKNKISWVQHLLRAGYRLYQLGDSFATHLPHKKSDSFAKWNKVRLAEGKNATRQNQIFDIFQDWLEHNVPNETQIPLCASREESSSLMGEAEALAF